MGITQNRWLIATGLALGLAGPISASGPTYGQNFGLSSGLFATGSTISVSYYGWDQSTVFGHTIWAFTRDQYALNFSTNCFLWNASCGSLPGEELFTKPYGVSTFISDPTSPKTFNWIQGTEIIFGLMVLQQDNNGGWGHNWFFSGDLLRNDDHLAHLAFFSPLVYTEGVPGNGSSGLVPGTAGLSIFGFEDVTYASSDWDFNNALFALDGTGGPTDVLPEPVTLTLLATGLAGLGALRRRRRGGTAPG